MQLSAARGDGRLAPPAPTFVATRTSAHALAAVALDHALGRDVAIAGGGASTLAFEFARRFGYDGVDILQLHSEYDLANALQRRVTAASGDVGWLDGPLTRAALAGRVLIVEGVESVPMPSLVALFGRVCAVRRRAKRSSASRSSRSCDGQRRRVAGAGADAALARRHGDWSALAPRRASVRRKSRQTTRQTLRRVADRRPSVRRRVHESFRIVLVARNAALQLPRGSCARFARTWQATSERLFAPVRAAMMELFSVVRVAYTDDDILRFLRNVSERA